MQFLNVLTYYVYKFFGLRTLINVSFKFVI